MFVGYAMVALAKAGRLKDRRRNKWVETREEDGKSVEYLMVYDELGYPMPRQRVIRFSEEDLREWEAALVERFPPHTSKMKSLVDVLLLLLWPPRERRRDKEFKRRRQQVLSHYGDIPQYETEVDDPYTKYVILREGEDPTPQKISGTT